MNLEYVRLLVTRFDGCFRFYRDIMGFKVTWGKEGGLYASFDVGEKIKLSLFARHAMAEELGTTNLPADATSQDRMALIFGVRDLDATVSRLQERGASFITAPKDQPDWGVRTACLKDPDGTLIEINSRMPVSGWSEDLRKEDSLFRKKRKR